MGCYGWGKLVSLTWPIPVGVGVSEPFFFRACVHVCVGAFACVNVISPWLSLLHFGSHSCLPFHFHMHKANRQTISRGWWHKRGENREKWAGWGVGWMLIQTRYSFATHFIGGCLGSGAVASWQPTTHCSVTRVKCYVLRVQGAAVERGVSRGRIQVFWHIQGANDGKLESQAGVDRICAQKDLPGKYSE